MSKLLILILFVFSSVQASGSPISEDQYLQLSSALKEEGYVLNTFGTKRIAVKKVNKEKISLVGWVSSYSSEKSVAEYFKFLDDLFEQELASSSGENYVAKCFDNPLDSSPNISCTSIFQEEWELSVYLLSGQENDFLDTVKRINCTLYIKKLCKELVPDIINN